MVLILPETKGISLERMDKIFGQVDYVEAGEEQAAVGKVEAMARADGDGEEVEMHMRGDDKDDKGMGRVEHRETLANEVE